MAFGINFNMEDASPAQENDNGGDNGANNDNKNVGNNGTNDNPDENKDNQDGGSKESSGEGVNNNADTNNIAKPAEGTKPDENSSNNVVVVVEPSEEQVVTFLKNKGGKFEKIEDLFQEKQAPESPYSSIIDDPEVKSFLDFKKETGRGFDDYLKVQENIKDIPDNELAIAKAESELGAGLTREDLVDYIQEKTGVDIDGIDELTYLEKRKVALFVKDYKEGRLAEQEKYKTPLKNENNNPDVEIITLEDGQKVDKKLYEEHTKIHQAYIEDMKAAVDSVAKTSLSIEFDNAGKKETLSFDYEYDADDKKNMVLLASDIDQTAAKLFRTEKGFDHQSFAKAVWRLDPKNWEKEVSAIVNKAIADNTLKLQKIENNVNFNTGRLPNNDNANQSKNVFQESNGFGMKFSI